MHVHLSEFVYLHVYMIIQKIKKKQGFIWGKRGNSFFLFFSKAGYQTHFLQSFPEMYLA